MLLNRAERMVMNNPIRAAVQRYGEARRLLEMGGAMEGGVALEVGCGRGVGTELILDVFGAGRVDAFDLDPGMVELAQRRLADRGDRVRLFAGDITAIEAGDDCYDAVFDFGIIHHVPSWESALEEVFRVLRPGGRLYAEEVFERFIVSPVWRTLLDHPQESRFDLDGFAAGLRRAGFEVTAIRAFGPWFGWFIADKPERPSAAGGNGP